MLSSKVALSDHINITRKVSPRFREPRQAGPMLRGKRACKMSKIFLGGQQFLTGFPERTMR